MKQYPIWNTVTNCLYKSNKSYGNRDTGEVNIAVGLSSSNSHHFLSHVTTRRFKDEYKGHDNVVVFKFTVDGIDIKEMIFKDNEGRAGELIETNMLINQKGA